MWLWLGLSVAVGGVLTEGERASISPQLVEVVLDGEIGHLHLSVSSAGTRPWQVMGDLLGGLYVDGPLGPGGRLETQGMAVAGWRLHFADDHVLALGLRDPRPRPAPPAPSGPARWLLEPHGRVEEAVASSRAGCAQRVTVAFHNFASSVDYWYDDGGIDWVSATVGGPDDVSHRIYSMDSVVVTGPRGQRYEAHTDGWRLIVDGEPIRDLRLTMEHGRLQGRTETWLASGAQTRTTWTWVGDDWTSRNGREPVTRTVVWDDDVVRRIEFTSEGGTITEVYDARGRLRLRRAPDSVAWVGWTCPAPG